MNKYLDHELAGCAPLPLAAYLKALGVLRVLGGQADPGARGAWHGNRFVLTTRLDREALLEFFTWDYRPTPLVAPWNGGSGFYPHDSKIGIEAIAESTAPRFAAYREAIAIGRELIGDQDEAPTGEAKIELICACCVRLYELCAEWLDTALVLTITGRVLYPALLGTGGNDGRLDFSNNQSSCRPRPMNRAATRKRCSKPRSLASRWPGCSRARRSASSIPARLADPTAHRAESAGV